jgi:hypothetical protein
MIESEKEREIERDIYRQRERGGGQRARCLQREREVGVEGWVGGESEREAPNSKPQTSNPRPQTQNPELQTTNPKLQTPNPKPQTPNPKPQTPNPKPQTQTINRT